MTYLPNSDRRFLLLSGDSIHSGAHDEEIVSSMRKAMFTVPHSNKVYMEGVRERVRALGLGGVVTSSMEEFLKCLVKLGLAQWVSRYYVKKHYGESTMKDKKHGLDWIIRRKPS